MEQFNYFARKKHAKLVHLITFKPEMGPIFVTAEPTFVTATLCFHLSASFWGSFSLLQPSFDGFPQSSQVLVSARFFFALLIA